MQLKEDLIISKDYQESITVPENITLTIEGQTNKLINVNGGTVIVKGVANRINGFAGKIIIQKDGFVDSVYCGNKESNVDIFGKVHQVYLLRGATLTMKKKSHAVQIYNDNSTINIMTGAYIKQFYQFGNEAKDFVWKKSKVEKFHGSAGLFTFYNEEKE